jgi:transcriptional regulator with XRE-family HTH domain
VTLPGNGRLRFRALADFLRRCRVRTAPERVGLTAGRRQRLAGLRREQVAQLAGISEAWYARLEQGREHGVSRQVLHGIADALRLEPVERTYLFALAGGPGALSEPTDTTLATLSQLLRCLDTVPALIAGPRWDILLWNRAAGALYGGLDTLPKEHRNVLWLTFGSPLVLSMVDDWERQARALIAQFRLAWAHHLEEPAFGALVETLSACSPHFAAWWAEHDVRPALVRERTYHHPLVGRLFLDLHLARVHDPAVLWQAILTPQPATGTEARLRQLVDRTYADGFLVLSGESVTTAAF